MFEKKHPKIKKSQIKRALGSSQPLSAEAAQASGNSERRKSSRRKIWAPCRLTWSPNGSADGVCLDVSETSARIRFRHKIVVPVRFRLYCPRLDLNHDCELVRQDGFDASVRFLP